MREPVATGASGSKDAAMLASAASARSRSIVTCLVSRSFSASAALARFSAS